jgi:hypothetical protein
MSNREVGRWTKNVGQKRWTKKCLISRHGSSHFPSNAAKVNELREGYRPFGAAGVASNISNPS